MITKESLQVYSPDGTRSKAVIKLIKGFKTTISFSNHFLIKNYD